MYNLHLSPWCKQLTRLLLPVLSVQLNKKLIKITLYVFQSSHQTDRFTFYVCLQVNGINLLQIPARDAYAYGRSLLEVLFTKEELSSSVVYKTKKSEKPPLPPDRVQLMFGKGSIT